jgi:hypothetical protein
MTSILLASVLSSAGIHAQPVESALTLSGRLTGKISIQPGRLTVGIKPVFWSQVILAHLNPNKRTYRSPNVLRLKTGEVWHSTVLSCSGGKLKFKSSLFGTHEIATDKFHRIDFSPRAILRTSAEDATLYRLKDEAVPGQLLWIGKNEVTIDSPLGVVTIPRITCGSYRYSPPPRPARPANTEIGLIDGSQLVGEMEPGKNQISLKHPILGQLIFPAAIIRTIRRPDASITFLSDLQPAIRTKALFASKAPQSWFFEKQDFASAIGQYSVRSILRLSPSMSLRYRLHPAAESQDHAELAGEKKSHALTGALGALKGAKGAVIWIVKSAGMEIYRKEIAPDTKPEFFSISLPSATDLSLEVEFCEGKHPPCGILLGDAAVIHK